MSLFVGAVQRMWALQKLRMLILSSQSSDGTSSIRSFTVCPLQSVIFTFVHFNVILNYFVMIMIARNVQNDKAFCVCYVISLREKR